MKYRNIIWDWNGTILNDAPVAYKATNILLERYRRPTITLKYYRDNIDTPIINFYAKIFDLTRESMETLDAEWGVLYNQLSDQIALHSGITDLLDFFEAQNCRQMILSAFRANEIMKYAQKFSVDRYFEAVLGTEDIVMESKTIRGSRYMKEHGYDPAQTLYIGDTVHDRETAEALGVDCILFSGGQQSPELLQGHGIPVFDSFDQIRAYLIGA